MSLFLVFSSNLTHENTSHDHQILSLNKNRIRGVNDFLMQAVDKFPALKHLSLLGNPCCPSEIFGESREDYERCESHNLFVWVNVRARE